MTTIGHDFFVIFADGFTNFIGLENLTTIDGRFGVKLCDGIDNFSGLENLTTLNGSIEISENISLNSLSGLENINPATVNSVANGIADIDIQDNPTLTVCAIDLVCAKFEEVGSSVYFSGNGSGCATTYAVESICNGEPCQIGIIYFYNQATVDNYPSNYPDCSQINGNVCIGFCSGDNNSFTNNLNGLNQITHIYGDLTIENNGNLSSLSGLNDSLFISGDLTIEGNDGLVDLNGYENITVGGNITISYNDNLTSLNGLEEMTAHSGRLSLFRNYDLVDISALSNLTFVDRLNLENIDVPNLLALSNLTSCNGISIGNVDELIDLDGLQNIEDFTGYFSISSCDSIESIAHLQFSSTIKGVSIGYNPFLTDISNFNEVTKIDGSLNFNFCHGLQDFSNLQNLTEISGYLSIRNNSGLQNISGLSGLEKIAGYLKVEDNDLLQSLDGLHNVNPDSISSPYTTVPDLTLLDNDILEFCELDNICTFLQMPDKTYEIANNGLECESAMAIETKCIENSPCNVAGLSLITQAEVDEFSVVVEDCDFLIGSICIGSCDGSQVSNITNLAGLLGLTQINGDLTIRGNPELLSFDGLENLINLNGSLRIQDNSELFDITALSNLDPTSIGFFEISNNAELSSCAMDNVCTILSTSTVSEVLIQDNNNCCSTREAIFNACTLAMPELDGDGDGFIACLECDDDNVAINPMAEEIVNNDVDEDCDGIILIIDNDGDGYNSDEDCDDENETVNPGLPEIANNEIDEDCDGIILIIDNDNDGYNSDEDCDDTNAAINPMAEEIANNDVDEDCDGTALIIDNDDDGYNSDEDCDDTNAAINPDAEEIVNNGIDEDCDGMDLVSSTDIFIESYLNIFPNPVVSILNIELSGSSISSYSIFDVHGVKIIEELTSKDSISINFSTEESGIYFLQITTRTGEIFTERVIVL